MSQYAQELKARVRHLSNIPEDTENESNGSESPLSDI
jgi:hypothetical protein